MEATELLIGQPVTIQAKDDFFAYVDGWQGTIGDIRGGVVVVHVFDEGVLKEFFVPPDQLRKGHG